MASPHFKNGTRCRAPDSSYMPRVLKKHYAEALADPELISMRRNVAIQEALLRDVLTRMDGHEQPPWKQVLAAYKKLGKAKDETQRALCMELLGDLLEGGVRAAMVYENCKDEARELMQEQTKTAQAEWQREKDLKNVMPGDQVLTLVALIKLGLHQCAMDHKEQLCEACRPLVGKFLQAFQAHVTALLPAAREQPQQVVVEGTGQCVS